MVTVDQKQSQSAHDLTLAPWPESSCQKAGRQEPREGKAASEAEGRSPGTWWKREREDAAGSDRENCPNQALGTTEAQPRPGCEDTGITTFGLLNLSHLIAVRIFYREANEARTGLLPQAAAGAGLLRASPAPRAPSPASPHHPRHRAMLCAFVIPHPTVPAKSLSCHNQAWSCRVQNNSKETSPSRGRGRKARRVPRAKEHQLHLASC